MERTDSEAETPILWPHDAKNWLIWKDLNAGKDWRWEENGITEDEMDGWHHLLYGHKLEQSPGVGNRQGSLAVHGVTKSQTQLSDWTELNWTGHSQGLSAWGRVGWSHSNLSLLNCMGLRSILLYFLDGSNLVFSSLISHSFRIQPMCWRKTWLYILEALKVSIFILPAL